MVGIGETVIQESKSKPSQKEILYFNINIQRTASVDTKSLCNYPSFCPSEPIKLHIQSTTSSSAISAARDPSVSPSNTGCPDEDLEENKIRNHDHLLTWNPQHQRLEEDREK